MPGSHRNVCRIVPAVTGNVGQSDLGPEGVVLAGALEGAKCFGPAPGLTLDGFAPLFLDTWGNRGGCLGQGYPSLLFLLKLALLLALQCFLPVGGNDGTLGQGNGDLWFRVHVGFSELRRQEAVWYHGASVA